MLSYCEIISSNRQSVLDYPLLIPTGFFLVLYTLLLYMYAIHQCYFTTVNILLHTYNPQFRGSW
jgi:hypothetical protein